MKLKLSLSATQFLEGIGELLEPGVNFAHPAAELATIGVQFVPPFALLRHSDDSANAKLTTARNESSASVIIPIAGADVRHESLPMKRKSFSEQQDKVAARLLRYAAELRAEQATESNASDARRTKSEGRNS